MKTLLLTMFLLASPTIERQHYVIIETPNSYIIEPAWAITDRILISTYVDEVSFGVIMDGVYTDGKVKAKYFREHYDDPVKVFITEKPIGVSSYIPKEISSYTKDVKELVDKFGGVDGVYNHKGKAWQ